MSVLHTDILYTDILYTDILYIYIYICVLYTDDHALLGGSASYQRIVKLPNPSSFVTAGAPV